MSIVDLPASGNVGLSGSAALSSGVFTVNDARILSTSRAQVQVISPAGTLGVGYKAVCTAGVLTVTAYGSGGATATLDTSTLQWEIIF